MKILGIDSSANVGSVALINDRTVIGEYTINNKKTHSQTLLPMIDELMRITDTDKNSLDAIAIAKGPGSFTGLRIGGAVAKGLGLALKCPLLPVSTLEALAYNCYGTQSLICPIMDARRGQVYTALYSYKRNAAGSYETETVLADCAIAIEDIVEHINSIGRSVVFVGDGVNVFNEIINNTIKVRRDYVSSANELMHASSVALLAAERFEECRMDAGDYEPVYLRLSQAERERLEKNDDIS